MPDRQMPSFTKSPPELVERFKTVLDRHPEAERKQMFGYPAAFVGGNMATGLFADRWMVRLPDDEVGPAIAGGAEPFEPMPGRPMKSFVAIPKAEVADDDAIDGWVSRGLAVAASMPAKQPKSKAKRA
jgi:TfoX N-terminal domain